MRAPACLALLAVAALPVAALAQGASSRHQLGLDFNDDAWRATYARELGSNPVTVGGGWLHHQDNGDVVHLDLQVTGRAASTPGVTGGLGGRLFLLDGEGRDREGFGLAVGGSLRYVLPRYNRFHVDLAAWYAPDVLAGGDVEAYRDVTARLGYSVTRQASLLVGARYVRGDYDDAPDGYFDTGFHVGIDLRF
jgi:hypothetical protein